MDTAHCFKQVINQQIIINRSRGVSHSRSYVFSAEVLVFESFTAQVINNRFKQAKKTL